MSSKKKNVSEPTTKVAELHLPYFKRGDDMRACLDSAENVADALEAHACHMDVAATMLRTLKDAIAGHDVTISADTHLIAVAGPVALIDDLIKKELLIEDQWDEEGNDDEEDDDDDDEEEDQEEV
jgi:hypothetical protein